MGTGAWRPAGFPERLAEYQEALDEVARVYGAQDGAGLVLDVVGELAQDTGPLLNAAVTNALNTHTVPRGLVLDIARLTFCDSGGLNASSAPTSIPATPAPSCT
ncbi:hypothetical protein [Kitasatospora sp. NPDC085879]|jgi:hypothetical protein|uniref:STAS domain-containing protein n=1 Tax=Kitasatospora sp. NPDC085879 TaxID=3154769 RepID=UPI0034269BC8